MDRHAAAALDRHITGNYGQDQFDRDADEDATPGTCTVSGCGAPTWEYLCDAHQAEAEEADARERQAAETDPLIACAPCGTFILTSESRSCEICSRTICEDCTDDCTGALGKVCRDCHTAHCRTRECWED